MKISLLQSGNGHCSDCHRGARVLIEFPRTQSYGEKSVRGLARAEHRIQLCARCASYLASTILERIDELRHES